MMDTPPRMPDNHAADIDVTVAEAIELIDQLVEVLNQENKILGRGFPASLIGSTARKSELGEAFETWVAAVRERHVDLGAADQALREAMVARSHLLNAAVGENVETAAGGARCQPPPARCGDAGDPRGHGAERAL
ncbi:MAG: hypothetical protein HC900_05865 [Methylacidiphilales bacterium]|nr:hypothetical protein [Candidatus Methylacidiphilales bacterium]